MICIFWQLFYFLSLLIFFEKMHGEHYIFTAFSRTTVFAVLRKDLILVRCIIMSITLFRKLIIIIQLILSFFCLISAALLLSNKLSYALCQIVFFVIWCLIMKINSMRSRKSPRRSTRVIFSVSTLARFVDCLALIRHTITHD